MRFYKLSMDMQRDNDIVCHYDNDFGIQQNELIIGKEYKNWDGSFCFSYDVSEGNVATDYLANDKGWFVVSLKLKCLLEKMNTIIQFLPVEIDEVGGEEKLTYYIANIVKLVDALCLEASEYFSTDIPSIGMIHTVSKFAIFENKTQASDIFKLSNQQEIPIFVSENFKNIIEENNITGILLTEIRVV